MLQNQICLSLNHRLTLTKCHNTHTLVMHTKAVVLLDNYSLGFNNIICQQRFLFNVFTFLILKIKSRF